jgi:uncharacterized membrane protein
LSLLPVILGIATAFFFGTGDFMSRKASAKIGPYNVVLNLLLIGSVLVSFLAIIFGVSFNVTLQAFAVMCFAAVTNFASVIFLYRALQTGVVSIVSPIAYSYPAITTLLGVFVLGERLSLTEVLSLIIIMAGAVLVSTKFSELQKTLSRRHGASLAPGVETAVISTVLSGVTFFFLGIVATPTNPLLPVFVLRLVGALTGILASSLVGQRVRVGRDSLSLRFLVMSVFGILGFISFNNGVASASNSLPIVASLGGMASAFQVAYAIVFLRERPDLNQAAGIFLLIAGVFTLLYLSA